MKLTIITPFFLLLGGLLLTGCSTPKPSIVLEVTDLDLGHVANGEVINRDITVLNRGEADLVIDSVTTSCGCTQASVRPMTLAPGESATLRIKFDSGAHGPELTGQLVRQVFVASNDPDLPEAEVELTVYIEPKTS